MNCIFCHKEQSNVSLLLKVKDDLYACDSCIRDIYDLLKNYSSPQRSINQLTNIDKVYTPSELKFELDRFVIGQEKAKIYLCSEAYTHLRRFLYSNDVSSVKKNNILLIGPSGVGKTLLATKLAEILGVPYVVANATSLTEAG